MAALLLALALSALVLSACMQGLPGAGDDEASVTIGSSGIATGVAGIEGLPGVGDDEASSAIDSSGVAGRADSMPDAVDGESVADGDTPSVGAGASTDSAEKLTEPFQAFLRLMSGLEHVSRTEVGAGGFVYSLDSGSLSVSDADGAELWRSDDSWWVDDFRLGDVDGDGVQDFVFSLWKSFRFGGAHPARLENDDETVRNHLFLYTALPSGQVKSTWGSSDLPRPIYSFDLDPSGRVTPVSSGMLLKTCEGKYRDDFIHVDPVERVYAWQGWGFVPLD